MPTTGPDGESRSDNDLSIPIELAELLHALLGPLSEILAEENHPWAAIAERVLNRYVAERDSLLKFIYGDSAAHDIAYHTVRAVERVCGLSDSAVQEAHDFLAWSSEVNGDPI